MKFFYTALTTENKKISGVLDTPDRDSAQAELHKMGVAILSVKEISENEYAGFQKEQEVLKEKRGIKSFQFLAVDANGKEVEGTIDAADDASAYRRLREEYHFRVLNLFPESASEEEKQKAKSRVAALESQLRSLWASGPRDGRRLREAKEEAEEAPLDPQTIREVDRVIVNARKALEDHAPLFSADRFVEIQETLAELERIRASNNLRHIAEVANTLFEKIGHPDRATPASAQDAGYQTLLLKMHESALVKKDFDRYKRAIEVSGIRELFKSLARRLQTIFGKRGPNLSAPPSKTEGQSALAGGTASKAKPSERAAKASPESAAETPTPPHTGRDFNGFWVEADSFLGWLLCFYLFYFFLVDFSLDKGIGLPRDFIFQTLKTPLLLNLTLLLFLAHWILRLRNLHLKERPWTALFLSFAMAGVYLLVIVNL